MRRKLLFLICIIILLFLTSCNLSVENTVSSNTEVGEKGESTLECTSKEANYGIEPETPEIGTRVTVFYLYSSQYLAEEKREIIEQYVELLTGVADISGVPFISKEVKENWDYLEGSRASFSVRNLIWEDEEVFAIYGCRPVEKNEKPLQRAHLILFRHGLEGWFVEKDVYSDDWMMEDVYLERAALLKEVLTAARGKAPFTDLDFIETQNAAIERNIAVLANQMNDQEKAKYIDALEVIYDPEWEARWLPRYFDLEESLIGQDIMLVWVQFDGSQDTELMNDIRDVYPSDVYGMAYILRNKGDGWTASYLGNHISPDPPNL